MRKIKLLFLGVIIPLMPLCAQIDSIQQLKEVVVTDIKLRDDSKTISVLKLSDSLTQFSSSNLKSVLNDFANIYTNENGPGGVSSVFLRGTNSNHTQVVWNGIPINSKFLGQSDLNLVNASNFDDISIRYGGGGIEYGSGAIGGTIHLNSNLDFKKSQQIKLQTSYGSFDTWSHQLKLKKSGAKFSSALSVNRSSSLNDYSIKEIDYENVDGDFNNTAVEVNLGYLIDKKHSLKLFSSFFDSHRKFSDSEVGMVQTSYDNLNSRNLLQHLFTNKRYVSTTSLANLYDEYQFYTNFNNETPLNDTNSRTFVFKNESSFSFSSDLQLKLIAEHNIVDAQGDGVGAADYNNSSLSLLLNHQFNKLFYNFKLRQEVYDFDSLSFSKAFNKTKNEIFDFFGNNEVNNNPFLYAFGLHYNPIKKLNFYTNASSNFRIPTLNERFWIGAGNPDILPENSQQYDFSAQLKGKLTDFKITYYKINSKNLIVWLPGPSSSTIPINISSSKIYGLSFYLATLIATQNKHVDYKLSVMYDYNKTENLATGNEFIYRPKHSFNSNFEVKSKLINFQYVINYRGSVFTTNTNTESLDGYVLHHINLSKQLCLFNKHSLQTNLRVNNLLNTLYYPSESYPGYGVNYNLSIQISI